MRWTDSSKNFWMYKTTTVTNIKFYIFQIYKSYNIKKDCAVYGKQKIH